MTCSMIQALKSLAIHPRYNYLGYVSEGYKERHLLEIELVEIEEKSIGLYETLKTRLTYIALAVASSSVLLIYSMAIPKLFVPFAIVGALSSVFVLLNPVWNRLLEDKRAAHLNKQAEIVRDYALEVLSNIPLSYKAGFSREQDMAGLFRMTEEALNLASKIASMTSLVIHNEFSSSDCCHVRKEIDRINAFKIKLINHSGHDLTKEGIMTIVDKAGPILNDVSSDLVANAQPDEAQMHIITIASKLRFTLLRIAKAHLEQMIEIYARSDLGGVTEEFRGRIHQSQWWVNCHS